MVRKTDSMGYSVFLKDDSFEAKALDHVRPTARAVAFLSDFRIALHTIQRDDLFGKATYHELPGGGIEAGETGEEAVLREVEEEIGYKGEVIRRLCDVTDFYYPIKRENRNIYYLVRLREKTEKHFASSGDLLIAYTEFLTVEEAISRYVNQESTPIGDLVRKRELVVLRNLLIR